MKSQGMPMQTIALIIIIIIVLAGVAIFFFVYFGKGKGVVGTQTSYSKCKNLCMKAQSDMSLGSSDACNDFSNVKTEYNSPNTHCSTVPCQITKKDGTTCDLRSSSCSCP